LNEPQNERQDEPQNEPSTEPSTELRRWRDQLEAWRIPAPILEAAPESPWGFPAELFRRRAEDAASPRRGPTPTTVRAREALPPDGSVLDVGCGGGATSLPLSDRAGTVIGVDAQEDMLKSFLESAAAAGVAARTVLGAWPEAAHRTELADVVVCGHVLYNVADIGPFVTELAGHARRRAVVEITDRHPLWWMRDLWEHFHRVDRPSGPTAEDAVAVLRALGLRVHRADGGAGSDRPDGGFARREDAVALIRRRLCLPADRDAEVEAALGDRLRSRAGLWSAGPEEGRVVTLWWDAPDAGTR
jgi:SAM-dependent methyltransferase